MKTVDIKEAIINIASVQNVEIEFKVKSCLHTYAKLSNGLKVELRDFRSGYFYNKEGEVVETGSIVEFFSSKKQLSTGELNGSDMYDTEAVVISLDKEGSMNITLNPHMGGGTHPLVANPIDITHGNEVVGKLTSLIFGKHTGGRVILNKKQVDIPEGFTPIVTILGDFGCQRRAVLGFSPKVDVSILQIKPCEPIKKIAQTASALKEVDALLLSTKKLADMASIFNLDSVDSIHEDMASISAMVAKHRELDLKLDVITNDFEQHYFGSMSMHATEGLLGHTVDCSYPINDVIAVKL